MIMLVKTVQVGKPRLFRRVPSISAERLKVMGMKCAEMSIPIWPDMDRRSLDRARRRALVILGEMEISTVCLRDGFPYPEWFSRYRRPDGASLRRRLTAQMIIRAAEDDSSVFVYARRLDRDVKAALRQFCGVFRYVMVSCPENGAGEYMERLTMTSGASVMLNPPEARIRSAQNAAIFDPPPSALPLAVDCVTASCGGFTCGRLITDIELTRTDGSPIAAPEGYDAMALANEAILRGELKYCDILTGKFRISP